MVLVVKWCCYSSSCPPYVDLRRVLYLSTGQCPSAQGAWGNQLSHNIAKRGVISESLL